MSFPKTNLVPPLRFMTCRCCGNRVLRSETEMCRQCHLAINREAYQVTLKELGISRISGGAAQYTDNR